MVASTADASGRSAGTLKASTPGMFNVAQELETDRDNVENLKAVFQSHEEELSMEGIEVEETIAELNAQLNKLQQLAAAEARLRRKHARACARMAEDDAEYFRVMCKLMDPLVAECSSHPLVKQWPEVRRLWKKRILQRN